MLSLSRKVGEEIVIGGNIRVVVTGIDRNQVVLSIDAPKEVAIYRLEVLQKIEAEEKETEQ